MTSIRPVRLAAALAPARPVFALVAALAAISCSDAAGPSRADTTLRIAPVADSVFEGDVIHLTAKVFDRAGAEVQAAPIAWVVSDSTLARVSGEGTLTLLRPGIVHITARSDAAVGTYDLAIGRLVVTRVEVSPKTLHLGRGDRSTLAALVFGQGDRAITGRTITFTSDDTLVVAVGGVGYLPNYLRATGPGSTTIRARVDGVTGTAPAEVVLADTTFALTQYNGSPLPVLIAADTVTIDGKKEFDEVYAESGTFVESGVLQRRYQIEVRYTQYHVTRTADSVTREPRFAQREFDRGVFTAFENGSLVMTSEWIYPLVHTAAPEADGFLVHYRIPGDDSFLDLRYKRVAR